MAVFSPDGRRVAFSSMREGTRGFDLLVKDLADGSPSRSVLTRNGDQFVTQWLADTLLLFEDGEDQGFRELWMLGLSDPESPNARPYLSSEVSLTSLVVSPDGGLAAYRSSAGCSLPLAYSEAPRPGCFPSILSSGTWGSDKSPPPDRR
jgi:hypothetical protein